MISRIPRYFLFPALVWLVWVVVIAVFQFFIQPKLSINIYNDTVYKRMFLAWVGNWDAQWFLETATSGYRFPNQAYFPLVPVLITGVHWLGISVPVAAYIVSHVMSLGVLVLFYYFCVVKLKNSEQARLATIIFVAYPGSMFLLANFSEGPTLFFSLLSFIFFEQERYLLSSLMSGVASAARVSSLVLVSIYWFAKKRIGLRFIYALLAVSGAALYVFFLWYRFGDPLIFYTAEKEWCTAYNPCRMTFPLLTPLLYLFLPFYRDILAWNAMDLVFTFVSFGLLAQVYRKFGIMYAMYSLGIVSLWLLSGRVSSMTRYLLPAFPLFMVVPTFRLHKSWIYGIAITLALIQLIYIDKFTSHWWVG